MIDILYLAKGREEFTEVSLKALAENTNWASVSSFSIFTDGNPLPWTVPNQIHAGTECLCRTGALGGPVAIMNDYLKYALFRNHPLFFKIDNDVIVPPGWLEAALAVMEAHPELEFLGLEPPASRTANPATGKRGSVPEDGAYYACTDYAFETCTHKLPCYAPCDSIGGVGLMRRSAFANRSPMIPSGPRGVGGFTQWQIENKVRAGWIVPPLKFFLLDRLPFEPWLSLSKRYIAEGQQRPWTNYDPRDADKLWAWWLK